MDNQQEISESQQQAYQESLVRGEAFEQTVKTRGWEYIKSYYTTKIQQFATSLLLEEGKSITEFENERRELIGIRKLLGIIDNDIKLLEDERKKVRPATKK